MVCVDCGHEFENETQFINIDGDDYCMDCYDEIFFICDACEEDAVRDQSYTVYGRDSRGRRTERVICEHCYHRELDNGNIGRCCDCEDLWDITAMRETAYDNYVCRPCIENGLRGWFVCEGCDALLDGDDYGQDGYCQNCWEAGDDYDRDEEPEPTPELPCQCPACERERQRLNTRCLHGYSYKPYPIFHPSAMSFDDTIPVYYGLELETDNYRDDCRDAARSIEDKSDEGNERNYYLKTDGSLNNGLEVVFHPRTIENWMRWPGLSQLCGKIVNAGGVSFNQPTCGVHIHRCTRDLSQYQKTKIITAFIILRPMIEAVAQRQSVEYASFKFHEEQCNGNFKLLYKSVKNGDAACDRHVAVNIQNGHTIEFRVFRGTLKVSSLQCYLLFTDSMVEYVKSLLFSDLVNNTKEGLWTGYKAFAKGYLKANWKLLDRYLRKRGV